MRTIILHANMIGLLIACVFGLGGFLAAIKAARSNPYQSARSVWIVLVFFCAVAALTAMFLLPGALLSDALKQGVYLNR